MLPRCLLTVSLLGLIVPCASQGASDWSQVKSGLTPEQALAALGEPLMRRTNRGIDVWIYDSHGEIVFAGGPLFGWSLPVPNPESEARPIEGDVLFKPRRRLPSAWKNNNKSSTITAKSQPYAEAEVYWRKN
jgi:hypothetical protein